MGKAKPKAVVPPPLPVEEGRVPFVGTMHVVFDNLSWYYPIGDTAPTDLLQGVCLTTTTLQTSRRCCG